MIEIVLSIGRATVNAARTFAATEPPQRPPAFGRHALSAYVRLLEVGATGRRLLALLSDVSADEMPAQNFDYQFHEREIDRLLAEQRVNLRRLAAATEGLAEELATLDAAAADRLHAMARGKTGLLLELAKSTEEEGDGDLGLLGPGRRPKSVPTDRQLQALGGHADELRTLLVEHCTLDQALWASDAYDPDD